MPVDPLLLGLFEHGDRRQPGAIVADNRVRPGALEHQAIQSPRDPDTGKRGIRHQRQALAREVIDNRQNTEPAAIAEGIGDEIQ